MRKCIVVERSTFIIYLASPEGRSLKLFLETGRTPHVVCYPPVIHVVKYGSQTDCKF